MTGPAGTAPETRTVIVIGGPTASGKSGLAVSVAEKTNGSVINADSMQVYDALPILTAQPPPEDTARAPHLLYGALPPNTKCNAVSWCAMALEAIHACHARGRMPVITGGTGLYIRTLMEGISPMPAVPSELRAEICDMQREAGNPAFHAMLEKIDPVMAARLHPSNTQRLIRAYEVMVHTGVSLAQWQDIPPEAPQNLRFVTAALLPPRETLYAQCDRRFGQMLDGGALEETRDFTLRVNQGGIDPLAPVMNALGYRELAAYLSGAMTLDDARAIATQATRNYAKRQVTWFRNQLKAAFVFENGDDAAATTLAAQAAKN